MKPSALLACAFLILSALASLAPSASACRIEVEYGYCGGVHYTTCTSTPTLAPRDWDYACTQQGQPCHEQARVETQGFYVEVGAACTFFVCLDAQREFCPGAGVSLGEA